MIKQLNSQQSATSTTSGSYPPQRERWQQQEEQLHIHVLCQGWMYKRGQGGLFSSKKFRKRVSTVCCGGCGLGTLVCAGCCLVAKVCTLTPIFSSQTHTTTPQHHTVLHLGQHHQLPVLLSFQRTRPPVHQSQTPPTTLRLGQGAHWFEKEPRVLCFDTRARRQCRRHRGKVLVVLMHPCLQLCCEFF